MRLYLNAESKEKIGYIADCLRVTYKENNQDMEIIFHIEGEYVYENNGINLRCKGELVPWVIINLATGEEIDLFELSETMPVRKFSDEEIATILQEGKNFVAEAYPPNGEIITINQGNSNHVTEVYPADEEKFDLSKMDIISPGTGRCEYHTKDRDYDIKFNFVTKVCGTN